MRKFFAITPLLFVLCILIPATASASTRSLYNGLSGSDVVTLQNALIAQGYLAAGKNTGYFGPLTEAAVKKFQCAKGVICSGAAVSGYGIYGPRTQAAMGSGGSVAQGTQNPGNITGTSLTGPATGAFEISGWVPDWRLASATADVLPHLSQLNGVMPFALSVDSNGRLVDRTGITNKEPWLSFIAEAKRQKVRVVPSVMWGDGEAIHRILSNQTTRIALEDEIANLVKAEGWDGIDIDFEAKKHETIDYFSTFLKGLYQRMGNKWVYCTIEARMPLENRYSPGATIPDDATKFANDFNALNKYCDRVEIMAYDQGTIDLRLNKARSAPYAPVADPGWVETLVMLAAQNISKNKIIIGVPTYGYEYEVTPQPGGGYKYQRLWAFNPKYATDIAAKLGITPYRTSANELGFVYNTSILTALTNPPTGDDSTETPQQQQQPTTSVVQNLGSQINTSLPFNYMTWSDAQAIADKVELAHQLGVRGIAVFSMGGAEDQAMWNILK